MPWDIEIDDEEARRRIARFTAGLLDLRPFWPLVVPLFIDWMRKQFESQGAWAGAPWAPLSLGYAAWKMQRYPGRGILYAEGDLRQAASKPRRAATARTLTLTIDWASEKDEPVDLAWHQRGTAHMPARPLLFDQAPIAAYLDLERVASDYVEDLKRRIGL